MAHVVTGCSRGLGLELVKALVALPEPSVTKIYATARSESPTPALHDIIATSSDRVSYVPLDISNSKSISQAVATIEKECGGKGIDVLINNAGIQFPEPGGFPESEALSKTLATNVVGINDTIIAFLPLLQAGKQKKIINVSSTLGSITLAKTFAFITTIPSYKISKAALNMLTTQYALKLADEGFTVLCLSPGNLRTDLGGEEADLSTEEGAKATLDIIINSAAKDNGRFRNIYNEAFDYYDGKDAPW